MVQQINCVVFGYDCKYNIYNRLEKEKENETK